jgi:hypothetical protein
MSKEDNRTPQSMLEEGERVLEHVRRLRDSCEGPERKILDGRVKTCELLLEGIRANVEEIKHQSSKMLGPGPNP